MNQEYRFLAQMIRHGQVVKVAQFSLYGSMPRLLAQAWNEAHDGIDPLEGFWVEVRVLDDDEEDAAPAGGSQGELPLGDDPGAGD